MDQQFPNTVIAIGDRPLCVWDQELKEHNLAFCKTLNPEWFVDVIRRDLSGLQEFAEIPQSAALAVRLTYHHALETFFALLFALFQAPRCLPAWLDLYELNDLRTLIRRVYGSEPILNGWGVARAGWKDLSTIVNQGRWESGNEATLSHFAEAWKLLAVEFLDDKIRAEYNGLKHGFRARPSGGAIKVGIEPEYGVPPPPEAMQWLGGSRHGSSAFITQPIPPSKKRRRALHVHLKTTNVLWVADATVQKTQILALSMQNVLSAARVRNGVPASEVLFHRLSDADAYEAPWKKGTGIPYFDFSLAGPSDAVAEIGKEKLLAVLRHASGRNDKS